MRVDDADPPRLEKVGTEALRALVRSRQVGPTAAVLARMSERLASAAVSNPAPPERPASAGRAAVHRWKLGVLAVAVAAGLALWFHESPRGPSRSVEPAVAPTAEPAARHVPDAPPLHDPGDPAATSVDDLPSAPPARVPNANASGGDDRHRTSSTELELVQRMKAASTVDPVRALALTNEHARHYPSGEFVQEREVIAVEALVALGKRDDAARRADALVGRFPNTPYTARLEKAIGHPLSQGHPRVAEPGAPLP